MDDTRLKNPPGPGVPDYFDELLARIRDIRSSKKVFWRKVLQIYATSIDYDPSADASQRFFATVQNKMHWAAHVEQDFDESLQAVKEIESQCRWASGHRRASGAGRHDRD